MREIKFRFYSNHLGKFVTPDDSIFVGALKDRDMNPMQYTGLKDKNGVEIYEGDVLSPVMINGSITNGKVYFDLGSYMVQQIGAEGLADELIRNISDVIGNIHENPELLEPK